MGLEDSSEPCARLQCSPTEARPLETQECFLNLQFGVFWTCGQICSSTSRLLVQEGIADKFYKQLKQRAESIKISDPMEEDCRLGPVISAMQYKKVMGAVEVRLRF